MYVCLWSPGWSTAVASAESGSESGWGAGPGSAGLWLVDLTPRVRVDREVVWTDGRGLDPVRLAERLLERLAENGVAARAGVAAVPVVAELAARTGAAGEAAGEAGPAEGVTPFLVKERTGWGWRKVEPGEGGAAWSEGGRTVVRVERGREAEWLAPWPVGVLRPEERLRLLLEGVGVDTVGKLAALEREAVEVRFGAEAVELWRLARGDDRRLLFGPVPPQRPHGSIDFVDYVLTDPARLLFTANALLGPLCDRLGSRGEHARAFHLILPLANGAEWRRTIRPARPTASRDTWLRRIREVLERLTVPDAVAGMRLEVGATEPAAVRQGDLFDRGFASASAVEAAVDRLAERQVFPLIPVRTEHPVLERRSSWRRAGEGAAAARSGSEPKPGPAPGSEPGSEPGWGSGLKLQLLEPKPLRVETRGRRDHEVPVRVRYRGVWRDVVVSAGPDRISGGQWEVAPYAREYHRCITDEGVPLWIFRDGRDGAWYLQGYWD